jgi:hypothetical protein
MKLNLKLFSKIRLLRLHNVIKKNFKNPFFNNISNRNKNGKNKNNSRSNSRSGNIDSRDKKKARESCGAAEFNILQLQ